MFTFRSVSDIIKSSFHWAHILLIVFSRTNIPTCRLSPKNRNHFHSFTNCAIVVEKCWRRERERNNYFNSMPFVTFAGIDCEMINFPEKNCTELIGEPYGNSGTKRFIHKQHKTRDFALVCVSACDCYFHVIDLIITHQM